MAGDGARCWRVFSALGILIAPDDRQGKIWKRASSERSTNNSSTKTRQKFAQILIVRSPIRCKKKSE